MKTARKRIIIVFLAILTVMLVGAPVYAAYVYRADTEASFITDSDSDTQYLFGAGGSLHDSKMKEERMLSVLAGEHTFAHDNAETFGFLSLLGKYEVNNLFSAAGRFKLYADSRWTVAMPGATLSFRPVQKAYMEVSYDRDLVDTFRAVRAKEYVDTVGISADYEILKPVTAVAAYDYQHFADGNEKDYYVAKLIFAPESSRFNTIAAYRYVTSEFKSPLYFSPHILSDILVAEQFRQPVFNDKFVIRLKAGMGWQWINDRGFRSDKALTLAEGSLKGWFTDHWGMNLGIGMSNSSRYGNYTRFFSDVILTYSF